MPLGSLAARQPVLVSLGLMPARECRAAYRWSVNTVHLTDTELALTRNAMQSYLSTFGHDEADVRAQARSVIAKLNAAEQEEEDPIIIG